MARCGATTVEDYLAERPTDRCAALGSVREVILERLPLGYEESMRFGLIGYVVPLEMFPVTYNGQPLMYAALASQKNYMSLYLMNTYGDRETERWFVERYAASGKKLNVGKSCVRFKGVEDLPIDLIGEVIARTPMAKFIELYEASRRGM